MNARPLLIVGARGQVGREVAELAGARGLPHVAWDRDELDITRRADVLTKLAELRPAAVINCAAYTAVDKAESEPELAFAINRDAPGYLAEACAGIGARLLHVSTDYVFDGLGCRPYREDDPVNPLGVYGLSKWEGEERVRALCPEHAILRTSWVFGRYGHNFVKTMLKLGAERTELRIVADQHGGPTEAGSIAEILLALTARACAPGTYHFSGQPETTWHAFADAIFAELSTVSPVRPRINAITSAEFPTPARRPAYSVLDNGKLQAGLGRGGCDWQAALKTLVPRLAAEMGLVS